VTRELPRFVPTPKGQRPDAIFDDGGVAISISRVGSSDARQPFSPTLVGLDEIVAVAARAVGLFLGGQTGRMNSDAAPAPNN
jgi:hypothetical protein